ncbi:MAG: PqqD family peptide modification chaperone [Verrucomicrobiota bacterium]
MSQLSLASTVSVNADILESRVDDETVLMDVVSGHYYGLDEVASTIWENLKSPITVEKLIGDLACEFRTTPEAIESDVLEFLEEGSENELVEIS